MLAFAYDNNYVAINLWLTDCCDSAENTLCQLSAGWQNVI